MEAETHGSIGADNTFIGLDRCAAAGEAAPITIQDICNVRGWSPISGKHSHEFLLPLPLPTGRSVLDIISDICTASLVGAFSERPYASNGV